LIISFVADDWRPGEFRQFPAEQAARMRILIKLLKFMKRQKSWLLISNKPIKGEEGNYKTNKKKARNR